MGNSSHERLVALFHAASELPAAERSAYLDGVCPDAPALRAEVERLLAHDSDSLELMGDDEIASNRAQLESALDATDGVDLDSVPDQIGPYRILRRVGEGGMGVVFEAQQDSPKRRVALKISRPIHESDRRLRRFKREGEVLGRLEHPGIARIYQAGTFERRGVTQPYFAMEFVEGDPITAFVNRAQLPPRARLELLIPICEAVQHAHDNGIVHRDVKPSNVMLTAEGRVHDLAEGPLRAVGQAQDQTPVRPSALVPRHRAEIDEHDGRPDEREWEEDDPPEGLHVVVLGSGRLRFRSRPRRGPRRARGTRARAGNRFLGGSVGYGPRPRSIASP